jgi:hydrogenase-4 component E
MTVYLQPQEGHTKIIGYLTMETAYCSFSLFMAEMPFIIEVLIVIDLLI